jgi:hypothetical protein
MNKRRLSVRLCEAPSAVRVQWTYSCMCRHEETAQTATTACHSAMLVRTQIVQPGRGLCLYIVSHVCLCVRCAMYGAVCVLVCVAPGVACAQEIGCECNGTGQTSTGGIQWRPAGRTILPTSKKNDEKNELLCNEIACPCCATIRRGPGAVASPVLPCLRWPCCRCRRPEVPRGMGGMCARSCAPSRIVLASCLLTPRASPHLSAAALPGILPLPYISLCSCRMARPL